MHVLMSDPQAIGSTPALGAARRLVWTKWLSLGDKRAVEVRNQAGKISAGVRLEIKRWTGEELSGTRAKDVVGRRKRAENDSDVYN